ncbi:MAG: D-2-hydroxyacid dehydrogenase [Burkholderiales bacterium]|nr:D-2-hydroxyacid dehydrogenase [Burkholderiales bacterium]
MTGMLLSKKFVSEFGARLAPAVKEAGITLEAIHLPDDAKTQLSAADCEWVEIAFLTRDIRFSEHYHMFGAAVTAARNLKWVHFVSTGIDQHPFLPALIGRGVRLTTSAGTNGEPVGQTAIGGLLMLARGFPRWIDSQRRHAWEPVRGSAVPRDLRGQTIAVVGLGTIGATIARFCQALGMHVIGVRRSPLQPGDPVNEMHTLAEFPAVLPRCDWVVLACPLTDETRGLINAGTMALLPDGAHIINVARGGVADQPALIAALQSGRLGGAYLDVFEQEPLPPESPLWNLPNVIVSPHNASASAGNEGRAADVFAANLVKWARGEALLNERAA